MHLLVDSCMCPDRGSNPRPGCFGTRLRPLSHRPGLGLCCWGDGACCCRSAPVLVSDGSVTVREQEKLLLSEGRLNRQRSRQGLASGVGRGQCRGEVVSFRDTRVFFLPYPRASERKTGRADGRGLRGLGGEGKSVSHGVSSSAAPVGGQHPVHPILQMSRQAQRAPTPRCW